jgi:DNA-directed RNA polymerase specialized sigma subunit
MEITPEHMDVARRIAGRYVAKYNAYHYKKDLEGAAMLGLVEAVSRINDGRIKHDNYIGYICLYIHHHVRNEIRKNQTLVPPERNPRPIPCSHLGIDVTCHDFSIDIHDLMEELEIAMAGDELMRRIVDLRIENRTDQEVADALGIGRLVVQRARQRLLSQWREINVG